MTSTVKISELSVETINPSAGSFLPLVQDGVTTKINHFNFVKKVFVTSSDDLPTAAGGYHQLEDRCYTFVGSVSLTNGLQFGDKSCVEGLSNDSSIITFTGANAFLKSSTGKNFDVQNITILHTSSALVDFDTTTTAMYMNRVNAIGASGGTIDDGTGFLIEGCSFAFSTNGFNVTGATTYNFFALRFNSLRFTAGTGTMLDLNTTVTQTISIIGNGWVIGTGRKGIEGVASSANVNDLAIVMGNDFNGGGGTYLTNISPSDLKWEFQGNRNIKDSDVFGGGSFINNATTTVITSGTPIAINGTFVQSPISSRTTCSAAGLITAQNLEAVNKTFTVSMDISKSGGSTPVLTFWLYKNGAAISNIQTQRTVSTATGSLSMTVPAEIANGDTFQIYVDSDINVTITVVNCSIATS